MKVLILGGYGVFGGRLAELFSDISDMEILICGRTLSRAEEFCRNYKGVATVKPLQLDRADIEMALYKHKPEIVVDASGPFQDYGGDRYVVIAACIRSKVNYLDFADGADFVFGVSQFDSEAKQNEVFVLSGVSSFPVLTAAVLREIAKDLEIVSVQGGIAPSPYAGIGLNVMRAVIGYAGAPVKLMRNGVTTQAMGLTESMRFTISPPGRLPLNNTRFSLVDVPDLQVIPPEHKSLQDIWMGAGPVPEVLHRALNLLAKLRARFSLPSMVPLSSMFYRILNLMKFGEHRGGMFVHAVGLKDGKQSERSWHLLAEGDDGPYIPSMAIESIVRKSLMGKRPKHGARPATCALELKDYEKLFENRTIYTGFRGGVGNADPLYREILGPAFKTLPRQVQALHGTVGSRTWFGSAKVRRGKGMLAHLIAKVIGFPNEAESTSVTVSFTPIEVGEKWTRNFGGKIFNSTQRLGTQKNQHLLLESFGPIEVALALVVEGDRLMLVSRHWTIWGIPLPRVLLPSGNAFETERNGQFHFDVQIVAPLIGLIVAYSGSLELIEFE